MRRPDWTHTYTHVPPLASVPASCCSTGDKARTSFGHVPYLCAALLLLLLALPSSCLYSRPVACSATDEAALLVHTSDVPA